MINPPKQEGRSPLTHAQRREEQAGETPGPFRRAAEARGAPLCRCKGIDAARGAEAEHRTWPRAGRLGAG